MDRHLGFLEIPQPSDPKIEVKIQSMIKYADVEMHARFMQVVERQDMQDNLVDLLMIGYTEKRLKSC